jgi:hypothetical protein
VSAGRRPGSLALRPNEGLLRSRQQVFAVLILGDAATRDLVNHICHRPRKNYAAGIINEPLLRDFIKLIPPLNNRPLAHQVLLEFETLHKSETDAGFEHPGAA